MEFLIISTTEFRFETMTIIKIWTSFDLRTYSVYSWFSVIRNRFCQKKSQISMWHVKRGKKTLVILNWTTNFSYLFIYIFIALNIEYFILFIWYEIVFYYFIGLFQITQLIPNIYLTHQDMIPAPFGSLLHFVRAQPFHQQL